MNKPFLYCECCGEVDEEQTRVVDREQTFPVKGEKITVRAPLRVCATCEAEIYDRELDGASTEKAFAIYRERHHLLAPAEIRELRARYGLSQRDMARLLGMGEATVARYEGGSLPDEAPNRLLALMRDPSNMWVLLQERSADLPERTRATLRARLATILAEEAPERAARLLDVGAAAHSGVLEGGEPEVGEAQRGNREFSPAVLMEMMRFFALREGGIFKTKLNKLLFYADFTHFRLHGESISGASYLRFQFGPVPRDYDVFLSLLQREGRLQPREEFREGLDVAVERWHAGAFDAGEFSPESLRVMEAVHTHFASTSCRDISDISHEEEGYKQTPEDKPIAYAFAHDLKIEFA
jgi:putative zinc finger/helix-turn-helix YgiT family protein